MSADINLILAIDCGSTTTKAILVAKRDGGYRLVDRADAPTTVEAPFEDVTVGIRAAVQLLQDSTGRRLLGDDGLVVPADGHSGVDLALATSSAGGGLQMMVAGVMKDLTAKSAQRAALGAGAVVTEVLAIDDGRQVHERVDRIRRMRPDIILLSGGVDGGNISHVVRMGELLFLAGASPRFGDQVKMPVVFAGNRDARTYISDVLGKFSDLTAVDNLRPSMEQENVLPASQKIQEIFLNHVMAHAPNYARLASWVGKRVMPTPAAVGRVMQILAQDHGCSVLGVDVGGATTDVFSVLEGNLYRTVSANLGMSYSITNVLAEAGFAAVNRWLPFAVNQMAFEDAIANKMVRPVTVPETWHELLLEQAVARETIRLSFQQHCELTTSLKGVKQQRTMGDVFDQTPSGRPLVDPMHIDMIVGSGGVLSHAPRREQAALMLLDAIQPGGITQLFVDSIFMMPHIGLLEHLHPRAARDLLYHDCLVPLGPCIAPAGSGRMRPDHPAVTAKLEYPGRAPCLVAAMPGTILRVPLGAGEKAVITATPGPGLDLGGGRGVTVEAEVWGGCVGVILDARGRPIRFPGQELERRRAVWEWMKAMGATELDMPSEV